MSIGRSRLSPPWFILVVFALILIPLVVTASNSRAASAASTLTVTKTADTNDGICNEDCSLREAIVAATPGDSIDVPVGTFILTLGSQLVIGVSVNLSGAGPDTTIIQAAAGGSRVFTDLPPIVVPQVMRHW